MSELINFYLPPRNHQKMLGFLMPSMWAEIILLKFL